VIAVGDVNLEIALRITLRGTVRELATFMETLTSSAVVVKITGEMRSGKEGCGEASEFCERFRFGSKECGR
jgi:hypothetical protein